MIVLFFRERARDRLREILHPVWSEQYAAEYLLAQDPARTGQWEVLRGREYDDILNERI